MNDDRANVPPHRTEQVPQSSDSNATLDRRTVLAMAGGVMAAGLGAPGPGASPAAAQAPRSALRIDSHTHFSSLRFLDELEKQEGKPFILSARYRGLRSLTDPKVRLDILDRHEIDVHVLVPVPWLEAFPRIAKDRTLAPQMARLMNDELAAIVAKEPKRFRGVAIVPTVDPDAMVAELHRAVKELGFLGAFLAVGPTAKRLDHPDFEPLYKAVAELDAGLWLHPSRPPLPDYDDETSSKFREWQIIGWPHDTTSAMFRIVFAGVFERYPDIRIMTHHHGGFVPYYAPRMSSFLDGAEGALPTKIAKPYLEHFKKFYCDTACNVFAPKVLELALDFFGPDRVLFGSDVPFGPEEGDSFTKQVLRSLEAMQISPEVRTAILSGNSRRILKIT